jgi:Cytochrome P460
MKRIVFVAPLLSVALLAQSGSAPQYSKEGRLLLPEDYREWVFLSSGLGMSYAQNPQPNANPFFDNVFVNPAAYKTFLKTGTWPDKTALVLESRRSETKVSINKDGRVQADFAGVEIHVKDSSRGGWAFYSFAKGAKEGTLIPKTENCYSCHDQNGAVDSTFVQFYPTLIEAAKSKGTFKATER